MIRYDAQDEPRGLPRGVARLVAIGWLGAVVALGTIGTSALSAQTPSASPAAGDPNLALTAASIRFEEGLDLLLFSQTVAGAAGGTIPAAHGDLDGAPVLGYVFPTTLVPTEVGFGVVEGIVALAVTAHPDFDDTPLWDENGDRDYANDGGEWHSHWVVLGPDDRVPGGLAVLAVAEIDAATALPPTSPGLPIYLDSPGFPVVLRGDGLTVVVPASRVGNRGAFAYDAVTASMQVNTSDPNRPLLGVYEAHSVLSGDLSLPYAVEGR